MSESAKVDMAVDSYLRSKGYINAAQSLRNEANLQPHIESLKDVQASLKTAMPEISIPDYILFYNANEANNKSVYEDSFESYRKWIDESVDVYKIELRRTIWPVFVTMYLDLVAKGETELSRRFMDKFKSDHLELHESDIKTLSDISLPLHIASSQLASQYRDGKYFVQLSRYSFQLLLTYLQEGQWVLLLRLVNQYIRIQIYPPPATQDQDKAQHEEPISVLGLDMNVSEFNKKESLCLGDLPPDPQFLAEIERLLNGDGDSNLIEKIKREPSADTPNKDNVPLPPRKLIEAQQEVSILKDARRKLNLSGGSAVPSI
ncbi:Transcription initiation factor TFIID subunit 5, partial [Nowakowskiella sp. JEL0078]